MLCVGQFGVGLWERVCAVCRTVWCGFVGVSVCCVWDSLVWVCGFVGVNVWDSLEWLFGSEYVLCWTVWCGFEGVSV